MGLSMNAEARDAGKEEFWRGTVKQWKGSGKSQAEFCREAGLNANTFSTRKRLIEGIEDEARRDRRRRKPAADSFSHVDTGTAPAFIRFAVTDEPETANAGDQFMRSETPTRMPTVAAELTDASNGRRIRIFNGADQATVTALISALAPGSGSGF
jgi:hypothetical protein